MTSEKDALKKYELEFVYFYEWAEGRMWAVGHRDSAHLFICARCDCGAIMTDVINRTFCTNRTALCEECDCDGRATVPDSVFENALATVDRGKVVVQDTRTVFCGSARKELLL